VITTARGLSVEGMRPDSGARDDATAAVDVERHCCRQSKQRREVGGGLAG